MLPTWGYEAVKQSTIGMSWLCVPKLMFQLQTIPAMSTSSIKQRWDDLSINTSFQKVHWMRRIFVGIYGVFVCLDCRIMFTLFIATSLLSPRRKLSATGRNTMKWWLRPRREVMICLAHVCVVDTKVCSYRLHEKTDIWLTLTASCLCFRTKGSPKEEATDEGTLQAGGEHL